MSCWAAGRRSSAENAGAGGAIKTVAARAGKRVALGELTNVFRGRGRSSGSATEAVRLFLARSYDRGGACPWSAFVSGAGGAWVVDGLSRGVDAYEFLFDVDGFWCTPHLKLSI
jgi:hypothetical protein